MPISASDAPADAVVVLREARPDDEPFVMALYAGTRAAELALVDWSPEQKQAFVEMQFTARKQHYLQHFPAAQYMVVELGSTPAGHLIIDPTGELLRLVDIVLLPEYCGKGIGSALIMELQEEAARFGKGVLLHVEGYNPALGLYERLGFVKTEQKGPYWAMEWRREFGAGENG